MKATSLPEPSRPACSDCGKPLGRGGAFGRCSVCYHRWDRHGRPVTTTRKTSTLHLSDSGYSTGYGTARRPA